jgi:hypothetical protein
MVLDERLEGLPPDVAASIEESSPRGGGLRERFLSRLGMTAV